MRDAPRGNDRRDEPEHRDHGNDTPTGDGWSWARRLRSFQLHGIRSFTSPAPMFITLLHIVAMVTAAVGVVLIDRWLRRPL